ncbi:MAG: aspartate carbamoyltransferase catalytic subunit [Bdellovibrionota bacterium]
MNAGVKVIAAGRHFGCFIFSLGKGVKLHYLKGVRHLVSIQDLNTATIHEIVDKALTSKEDLPLFNDEKVALIFLEPSSRTRVSFECAVHDLKAHPILVQESGSSLEKNESLKDTLLIFRSMGIRTFVIRCKDKDDLRELTQISGVSIINAGDGKREHPTQALLDLTTLRSLFSWKDLESKELAIVGDLKSSRVAQSWSYLAPLVGIKLRLISPTEWKPDSWGQSAAYFDRLEDGLSGADIVMSLRVQKERHSSAESAVTERFVRDFQMNEAKLGSKAFLMHPGPTNWGVELDPALQKYSNSLILKQVKHGVDLRRAVLSHILSAQVQGQ